MFSLKIVSINTKNVSINAFTQLRKHSTEIQSSHNLSLFTTHLTFLHVFN